MNLLIRSDSQASRKKIDAALYELACNLYFVGNDIKMFSLLRQNYMDAVLIDIDTEDGYEAVKLKQLIPSTIESDKPLICLSKGKAGQSAHNQFKIEIEQLMSLRERNEGQL